MTDEQLADFLGIKNDPRWPAAIAAIPTRKRALYERMSDVCIEADLYAKGLGPKPDGVLLDYKMPRTRP